MSGDMLQVHKSKTRQFDRLCLFAMFIDRLTELVYQTVHFGFCV